ncbi:MAG: NnrS family protein [Pseudomonadota bacterium]
MKTSHKTTMAHRLLFPLATLYALCVVPFWLLVHDRLPPLFDAAWHGHEMLFGFALAVIAGFLGTHTTRALTATLVSTWIIARVAAALGSGVPAFLAGLAFPVTVFIATVPALLAGSKRPENRILPLLLTLLVAADAAWWTGRTWFGDQAHSSALLGAIDLIALLLLMMGGRTLRAALGNHLEQQGIARRDHCARNLELPLALLATAAALTDALALSATAGLCCLGAALLALLRVLPWQLRHALARPHLWTLALGYLWLVPGLALKGIAQLGGGPAVTDLLHGIGIGALGTLTLVMMARTTAVRARRPVTAFADIGVAAVLVSTAACCRLLAAYWPQTGDMLLWLAAGTWSGAFLILFIRLWRMAV